MLNKITDKYLGLSNEREREAPKKGIARGAYLVWNHYGKIWIIQYVFVLSGLLGVTAPAAFCGLCRYQMLMYKNGYGFEFRDFFKELKGQILKSLPIGLLFGMVLFYGYYLLSLSGNFQTENQAGYVWIIGMVVVILSILLVQFSFVMMATLDLPLKYILKNSCILMLCEWKASLGILLLEGLYLFIVFCAFPYSLLFVILGGWSIKQMFVVSLVFPTIERRILIPFEEQKMPV